MRIVHNVDNLFYMTYIYLMIVIAEFGSNIFPYSRTKLTDYLLAARDVGADAVKIQLFKAEHFPENERDAKRELEFPREDFCWFVDQSTKLGLAGGASVFDYDAVDLCEDAAFIKLATREQDNHRLRDYVHEKYECTIMRSVSWPLRGRVEAKEREVTLGCVPEYPSCGDALGAYPAGLPSPFGWSSHTRHYTDCYEAAKLGATVIEKHFTLSEDAIEAGWSLLPDEFAKMVREVR